VSIESFEQASVSISVEDCDQLLSDFTSSEALAETMIPVVGQLYRQRGVVTSIYGQPIVQQSVIAILKAHRFVRRVEEEALSVEQTWPVLCVLKTLPLSVSRIDIGKIAMKFRRQTGEQPKLGCSKLESFVKQEVHEAISDASENSVPFEPQDIVLYGFGRIGRLLARILIEKTGSGEALRLKAIVVRRKGKGDLYKRASLLRRDSVHGPFEGTIVVDEEHEILLINGNAIKVIYADDPKEVDYTQYGINNALVVDNTGRWRDAEGLGQHLQAKGASRVLLTAPGKGEVKNIVYGVNHEEVNQEDTIVSAASCTTNAITPVLKVLNEQYGIDNGHVETVHAYTNDQNLIDNFHKGARRGRSAALNMVITETGAATAVGKVYPVLAGRLTGNAIRVPTPNVSLAILNLQLNQAVDVDGINEFLRQAALNSSLRKQIDFTNSSEAVSSDFVGSRKTGVVDAQSTIVMDKRVTLYIWYDNEYGYSAQVIRLLQKMAGIEYPSFPKEMDA